MDIFHLECCLALAEHLNYTRAAEAMFIAQPVLSRMITNIENETGIKLFNRNSRGVSLTPAGKVFVDGMKTVVEQYAQVINASKATQQGSSGMIRMGVFYDTFNPFYVKLKNLITDNYPEIHVEFIESNHSRMVQMFEQGDLDIILDRISSYNDIEDKDNMIINISHPCLVVSAEHPLAQRHSVRADELKHEKFIAFSRISSASGHEFLNRVAANGNFSPQIVREVQTIATMLLYVSCREGVAVLTDSISSLLGSELTYVVIEDLPPEEECLIWRKNNTNPALEHVMGLIEEAVCLKEEPPL